MSHLKMFTDGTDTIIAESLEEARVHAAICDCCWYPEEWEELPAEKKFTYVHVETEGQPEETKTVGEWIAQHGAGFFATTEY
jgi:hypothetical protein